MWCTDAMVVCVHRQHSTKCVAMSCEGKMFKEGGPTTTNETKNYSRPHPHVK